MKQILVVDDNLEMLSLLELILVNHGHKVIPAASGHEAFRLLKEMKFDLVITDLEMDHGDGRWLLRVSRELSDRPRFIVASGNINVSEEDCLAEGALAFFQKPYRVKPFLDFINSILE